jgi:hypothetical protein
MYIRIIRQRHPTLIRLIVSKNDELFICCFSTKNITLRIEQNATECVVQEHGARKQRSATLHASAPSHSHCALSLTHKDVLNVTYSWRVLSTDNFITEKVVTWRGKQAQRTATQRGDLKRSTKPKSRGSPQSVAGCLLSPGVAGVAVRCAHPHTYSRTHHCQQR